MTLDKFLLFLNSYGGRDKLIRLLSYTSKFLSSLITSETSIQLSNFSSQLSVCRAAFRLLDFIPALSNAAEYGFGNKDEDRIVRILNIISNAIDIIFCPIDAVSWAIDCGVVVSKNTVWDFLNTGLWVASLFINIILSLRKYQLILWKMRILQENEDRDRIESKELSQLQRNIFLRILKCTLDIIFAVHYLPPGILWSGTLSKRQVGVLGSVSSSISIYQGLN